MVRGVIFGVDYSMLGKIVFFGVYVWLFWGSDGPPIVWYGRYANPIFGVEYLILTTKTKMLGKMVSFRMYVWPF